MISELEIFYSQLDDAISRGDDEAGRMALHRFVRARSKQIKPRPVIPTPGQKRASLMQLRPRHLATGEHIARRKHYDRASQHEFMCENYNRIFGGGLRSKAKTVPSDELRISLMMHSLLDVVDEMKREMISQGRPPNNQF
jgi:hypothetical protein